VIFGFSSGIEQTDGRPVPLRDMIFGNFSLVGALLAYVDKDQVVEGAGLDLKESALNPPSHALGKEVQSKLIDLLQRGKIRTVVDRVVRFEALPSALAAFERRDVMGRVIVEN
jgi:NADPH:quinone reductase-like Zn-dependent oxidoreductase